MIEKVVRKGSFKEAEEADAEYWATKTPEECLRAGTFLLEAYIKAYNLHDRVQKVRSHRNLHDVQ